MFTASLIAFTALSIGLLLLVCLTLFLATRHDKAVALAGPLEEEAAVLVRIAEKRATLTDLELELEERRKALALTADVQAEVDALIRQRDTLMVEWNQMADRRQEVEALRLDAETAQIAKIEVEAELATARADLEALRDRLARADEITRRIETLSDERDSLQAQVSSLQEQCREASALLTEMQSLKEEASQLIELHSATEGLLRARQSELNETDTRLEATKTALVAAKAEADGVGASLAASRLKLADLTEETDQKAARLADLRAKEAEMHAAIAELEDLQGEIATSNTALTDVKAKVEGLGATLAAAKVKLADLAEEIDQKAEKIASLQAEEAELRAAIAATQDLRGDLAKAKAEQVETEASLATLRQKLEEARNEAGKAQETNEALTARRSVLEREVEKLRALASGQSPADEDPLKDLKDPPEVVKQLRQWPVQSNPSEAEALHRVRKRFQAFGLAYPERTLRAFHTAMKVNETTQMAVLAGISGTGKSQLPRQYAAGMGIGFLQVPVQPRWDSPQDLMGFYNYIEGRFRPTDMARALHALDNQNNPDALPDRMLMVLLDEMNLARVEYYFSDFLSRLESRPKRGHEGDQNLRKDAEIELEIPKAALRIFPGYNLLFAGTMNEDESTQSLSDKVVDRANVLRFGAPKAVAHAAKTGDAEATEALDRKHWNNWCARGLNDQDKTRASDKVDEMLSLMQDFGKPFGHRLGRAILAYAGAYPEGDGVGNRVDVALADQIEMRLLPKLRGVDVEEKSGTFKGLEKMAESFGDDELAQAIRASVAAAEVTGQFVWKGVIR